VKIIFISSMIIISDISREYFTRHGLHINVLGKEKMARKISDVVKRIGTQNKMTPITLIWKDTFMEKVED
jgi:hypothetical protein